MAEKAKDTALEPRSGLGDSSLEAYRLETFAHAVAFGVPIPQALLQAGYETHTVVLGAQLLRDEAVLKIIEDDRAWMREKMQVSQEQIISQLDRDRDFAYACENPNAAVAATMNKAKVFGIADPHAGKGAPKRVIIEWGDDDQDSQTPQLERTG